MLPLHNSENGSPLKRLLRFGLFRGLRSVEIDPEDFRNYLARKHRLHVSDFRNMYQVPIERLDAIAKIMIRDAQRLALAEGAGFGLGGMITLVPDAGLLTIITLRLIQRLCLLYGFEATGPRTWGRRVQRNLRARHLAERSVNIHAGSPKIVVSFPAIAQ